MSNNPLMERYIWLVCIILFLALAGVFAANFGFYETARELSLNPTPSTSVRNIMAENSPRFVAAGLGLVVIIVGWILYSLAVTESRHQATLERQYRQALEEAYRGTLHALTYALDLRDDETYGHSRRVMHLSLAIGRRMGLSADELRTLAWGALIHDIGKIGIKDEILRKPGPLTPTETAIMRQHVIIGHQLVSSVPFLARTAELIRHHHERYDGQGYPDGLKGDEIPLLARIFAVADAFDAMTNTRPYRPNPLTIEAARTIIQESAGRQHCPVVVSHFLQIPISEIQEICSRSLEPVPFDDMSLLVDLSQDISPHMQIYYRDTLTRTGSRAAWEALVTQLSNKRGPELGTIVFFDMNKLKELNDNNGHSVGDRVLADLGARLLQLTPDVFRTGGDEFLAWFPPGAWTAETEKNIRNLLQHFEESWASLNPVPTVSWGVCHADHQTNNLHELMVGADRAMYESKKLHKATRNLVSDRMG